MIPIFCINLERATERKAFIQKEWIDKLGFDIKFWNGYDRRDIENNKFVYSYNKEAAIKIMDRELSHGEIACATSFCMLYDHLLKNNYDEVIIMEDDASPLINDKYILFKTIEYGKKEYPESNFMLLHGKNPSIKTQKTISKQKYFSEIMPIPWGNILIYLDNIAIKKTYATLKEMICPADYPQRMLSANKELNVIVVNNSLCKHNTNKTYIGNDLRFIKNIRDFIP
jgi:GR25 family glycosyltransferase involved in LPS biosynthesis